VTLRLEDIAVGDELGPSARVVTAEDVRAYAEASGDRNPLHLDDGFARSVGFDGVIAHGMFTMGHLAACLVGWLGSAEPLLRMKVSFRAPVRMGDTIVAGGRVRAIDPDARSATIELWVTVERDGTTEWPIKRGEADVRLPG
jgi:acyl dehydratase